MNPYTLKFIRDNQLTLLETVPVYYSGWELDYTWFFCVRENGEKVVVATNHENPYIATREVVERKCKEYRKVLNQTEAILAQI